MRGSFRQLVNPASPNPGPGHVGPTTAQLVADEDSHLSDHSRGFSEGYKCGQLDENALRQAFLAGWHAEASGAGKPYTAFEEWYVQL